MQPWSVMRTGVIRSRSLLMRLGEPAPPQRVLALLADRADVVVALIEHGDQLADLLRRILQVRIQGDHILAARVRQPRHHRRMLAEIRMKQHHPGLVGPRWNCWRSSAAERSLLPSLTNTISYEMPQRIERRIQPCEQASAALPPRCRPE